jgi:hypothetical protein
MTLAFKDGLLLFSFQGNVELGFILEQLRESRHALG